MISGSPSVQAPDDLRRVPGNHYVRLEFHIGVDGSATVEITQSSGNPEADRRVKGAFERVRWEPAVRNGEKVPSVERIRYVFEVD